MDYFTTTKKKPFLIIYIFTTLSDFLKYIHSRAWAFPEIYSKVVDMLKKMFLTYDDILKNSNYQRLCTKNYFFISSISEGTGGRNERVGLNRYVRAAV